MQCRTAQVSAHVTLDALLTQPEAECVQHPQTKTRSVLCCFWYLGHLVLIKIADPESAAFAVEAAASYVLVAD